MAQRKRKAARRPARARKAPAKRKVDPVPAAYGSVTPMLHIRNCAAALDFYPRAFGAKVLSRMNGPGGRVMHAELRFGNRIVMAGEEAPEMGAKSPEALGGSSGGLMLYVKDCDAAYARAVAAGCKGTMPPADMFWGDRFASLVDPYGHQWSVATRKANLSRKQMDAAAKAFMASQARPPSPPLDAPPP
jgi:PhnB protein